MRAMELSAWLELERGRQSRLAKHLNVKPPVVAAWLSKRRPIPFEHGAAIDAFTGGAVSRRDMFPNDWQRIWPELAATTAANDAQTNPQQEAAHG